MEMIPKIDTGVKLPNFTRVVGLMTTIPAFFRPIKAINMPIPADIANLRFLGMHSRIISLTLKKVIRMKRIPSTSITANDCSHVNPMPWHKVNAKKAFNPTLGACANGSFAIKASKRVAIADTIAVDENKAALSMPVVPSTAGFTAKI